MECLDHVATLLCDSLSALRGNLQGVRMRRRRTLAALKRRLNVPGGLLAVPPEAFAAAPGAVADLQWLSAAGGSRRKVPMHLWVLYREWVDRSVVGQVEHADAWHHFVAARALGLPGGSAEVLKPGQVADLLALLAQDGRLGCGTPVDSLQAWLAESYDAFDFRFRRARGRAFEGLSEANEASWRGEYSFVQLADPQLGMLHGDQSWEEELTMLRLSVQHINRLRPRFVLVSGDLCNAFPVGPQANPDAATRQVKAVKEALREIDSSIPIVVLPGNHDIGQVPTPRELDVYSSRWGDDYFSFWVGGVYYLVLNSQYYMDSSLTLDQRAAQDRWLETALAVAQQRRPKHVVVLTHVPPFIGEPNEPQGWANWELEPRKRVVALAMAAGARLWLSGHYHGNAVATYGGLEVVTSSSCGSVINWIESPDVVATSQRPDFARCVGTPPVIADARHSGLRIVRVEERACRHAWFVLADVPSTLVDVFPLNSHGSDRKRKMSLQQTLGLDEAEDLPLAGA